MLTPLMAVMQPALSAIVERTGCVQPYVCLPIPAHAALIGCRVYVAHELHRRARPPMNEILVRFRDRADETALREKA
jgi:hypothetical protein